MSGWIYYQTKPNDASTHNVQLLNKLGIYNGLGSHLVQIIGSRDCFEESYNSEPVWLNLTGSDSPYGANTLS